jgi:hypothetical protein
LCVSVDKELSKFLEKEISYEENAASKKNVKGFQGFDVSLDDANVTLQRKIKDET